jgi:excisionase family DNA binding protein
MLLEVGAMDDILTLAAAADELGVTTATLRQQIASGRLAAEKLGPMWVVLRSEVNRYRRESLGQPGRPPKPRRRRRN